MQPDFEHRIEDVSTLSPLTWEGLKALLGKDGWEYVPTVMYFKRPLPILPMTVVEEKDK